jgi:hypothetical protein
MQPPEVRGKLVLYCFRGGRKGWVEPRAQPCPKVKRWPVESLSYTASEVVGRDGSSPEPNHARRPTSGVAEVQLLEGTVSRRLVASRFLPKMLP